MSEPIVRIPTPPGADSEAKNQFRVIAPRGREPETTDDGPDSGGNSWGFFLLVLIVILGSLAYRALFAAS